MPTTKERVDSDYTGGRKDFSEEALFTVGLSSSCPGRKAKSSVSSGDKEQPRAGAGRAGQCVPFSPGAGAGEL